MTPPRRIHHGRRFRRGLGLVEMLIALAISATLLTAVAVATNASFVAYKVNQEQSDLTQRARLAIHRIVTELRQTERQVPSADVLGLFQGGLDTPTSEVTMYFGALRRIRYRQVGNGVYRMESTQATTNGPWVDGTERLLVSGVINGGFSITLQPQRSKDNIRAGIATYDQLRRATVRLTIQQVAGNATATETSGTQTLTLVGSVVPRRYSW